MALGIEQRIVTLGEAIQQRRIARRMSLAALATDVGVRPSEVARCERNEVAPPPTRIRAVARALGVDHPTMLDWIGLAATSVSALDADGGDEVEVVIDLAAPDPFVIVRDLPEVKPQPVAADPVTVTRQMRRSMVAVKPPRPWRPAAPPMGAMASVFPAPGGAAGRDEHIYVSAARTTVPGNPVLSRTARALRTVVALAGLTVAFVWAMHQLVAGFGDVISLFRGSGG